MKIKFSDVRIGEKFRDTFYSGDWCIKTGEDTARPIESAMPMCYCISPKSDVEIEDDLRCI